MNIIVCVKRVPDTETKVKIGGDEKTIDEQGVQFVLNPYDEIAVEEALRIKEKQGKGEVTILSVGSAESATTIRSALAMGADRGILVKDDSKWRDPVSVAGAIAAVLQDKEYDILFFGRQAVDDQSLQVGPMVAAKLEVPCVTDIAKLEIEGEVATCHREAEGGTEVIEVALPGAFTAQKGLNEPRYASLRGIMQAKRKPLDEVTAEFPEEKTVTVKMEYPAPRKAGKIVGEGPEAVPELVRLLQEEAKLL